MFPRSLLERLGRYFSGLGPRPRGTRGRGADWERLAEKELASVGYRILTRNFRTREGEIDFVAEQAGVLCFIEVKGRSGEGFGPPEAAVNVEKQRRIFRTAEAYLRRARRPRREQCRFDVVSILDSDGVKRIEIFQDAFQGPPRRRARR